MTSCASQLTGTLQKNESRDPQRLGFEEPLISLKARFERQKGRFQRRQKGILRLGLGSHDELLLVLS